MNAILFPAAIEGVSTRKDNTLTIRLATNELPPGTMADLFCLKNALCYVAVKPEDFGQAEIERLEAVEAEMTDDPRKTHSKRLRAVFYRMWESDNEGFKGFEAFYFAKMDALIEHYKKRLP